MAFSHNVGIMYDEGLRDIFLGNGPSIWALIG